jgi:arylsulfatase A-like enzyme
MKLRTPFLLTLAITSYWLTSTSSVEAASTPEKPNLLFVFTDQHSFDMLGCYGNSQIKTPNIDRLAREGVRFEYCISSTPVCAPMRAMLLSGQHPLNNGVVCNDVCMLPGHGKYFGEVLRDNGYRLGYIGKWHLYGGDRNRPVPPGPYRYGFDDVFLTDNCSLNFDPGSSFYFDPKTGEKVHFNQWEVYGQTDQALEFIQKRDPHRPWALFLSWHPPHDHKGFQYATLPELEKLYDPATIKLRPSMQDTLEVRKRFAQYMAMISGCDLAFGKLMDALEKSGMKQNTIVVFTSDHGDLHGAHGRPWAKSFPEDESSRVPLIIRYPDRLQPRTSHLLVGTLDLMPTLLGLLKLPIPATCDGQNLTPHILSRNDEAVESVPLFYFAPSWRGVFTKGFTYSERAAITFKESINFNTLYDRSNDPHQLINRFDDPAYAKAKAGAKQLMHSWLGRYQDPFITETDMYHRFGWASPKLDDPGMTGQLPGRPRDLIKAAPTDGIEPIPLRSP